MGQPIYPKEQVLLETLGIEKAAELNGPSWWEYGSLECQQKCRPSVLAHKVSEGNDNFIRIWTRNIIILYSGGGKNLATLCLCPETLCVENLFGRVNVGTALHGSWVTVTSHYSHPGLEVERVRMGHIPHREESGVNKALTRRVHAEHSQSLRKWTWLQKSLWVCTGTTGKVVFGGKLYLSMIPACKNLIHWHLFSRREAELRTPLTEFCDKKQPLTEMFL